MSVRLKLPHDGRFDVRTTSEVVLHFCSPHVQRDRIRVKVDGVLAYDGSANGPQQANGYRGVKGVGRVPGDAVEVAFAKTGGFAPRVSVNVLCEYQENGAWTNIGEFCFNTGACDDETHQRCVGALSVSQVASFLVVLSGIAYLSLDAIPSSEVDPSSADARYVAFLRAAVILVSVIASMLYYFFASWTIETEYCGALQRLGRPARIAEVTIRFLGAIAISAGPMGKQFLWGGQDVGPNQFLLMIGSILTGVYASFLIWDLVVSNHWGNRRAEGKGIPVWGRDGFVATDAIWLTGSLLLIVLSQLDMLLDLALGILYGVVAAVLVFLALWFILSRKMLRFLFGFR